MKIIITGGAGFIGCNAAARSISRGDRVVVIDDLSRVGSHANLEWLRTLGAFDFHRVDLRDDRLLADTLRQHADAS
ncbi:MAG TPA: NAD-dependent epimerase/dehydratase family protein, partial [Steroidobacteraceae bacterium]